MVITGVRRDRITYSDGISANEKYFKCDWTLCKPKEYLLSNALCLHIWEMIEIQNGMGWIMLKTSLFSIRYISANM